MDALSAFLKVLIEAALYTVGSVKLQLGNSSMYDWVPYAFATFKGVSFVACMFFAIKWHYDQGKKKGLDSRTIWLNAAKIAGAFFVALALVVTLTLFVAAQMGMDLSL